jgi:hypothetical protein
MMLKAKAVGLLYLYCDLIAVTVMQVKNRPPKNSCNRKEMCKMNWFFYLLVAIGLVALWFLCSFAYKPIGKFFHHIYKDARDEILEDNKKGDNENG